MFCVYQIYRPANDQLITINFQSIKSTKSFLEVTKILINVWQQKLTNGNKLHKYIRYYIIKLLYYFKQGKNYIDNSTVSYDYFVEKV